MEIIHAFCYAGPHEGEEVKNDSEVLTWTPPWRVFSAVRPPDLILRRDLRSTLTV